MGEEAAQVTGGGFEGFVAESLLGDEESNAPIAKVKPWRAWALCGWLVAVVVCYVVMLLSTRS